MCDGIPMEVKVDSAASSMLILSGRLDPSCVLATTSSTSRRIACMEMNAQGDRVLAVVIAYLQGGLKATVSEKDERLIAAAIPQ